MRPLIALSATLLLGPAMAFGAAGASPDVRSFAVREGDAVIVQNDYGLVRIAGWTEPELQVRIEKRPGSGGTAQANVLAEKRGDKVFVYAFFTDNPGESVDLEFKAPPYIDVVVWGANPDIEIRELQGTVRAQTLTGEIVAEELTGAVSLLSERGDIVLRCHRQPKGDLRLETTAGSVACELSEMLNARVWFRGGAGVTLAGEPPADQLEKQFGTGGPLIYASSLKGKVRAEVRSGLRPAGAPASPASPEQAEPAPASGALPSAAPKPPAAATPPPAETAPPQPPPGEAQPVIGAGGNPLFKVKVDWVFLNASVRDRYTNRSIPDLQQGDFEVYEDGVLQEVAQFENTEAPFHLLLLLDVSGSTAGFIDLCKEASIRFTGQINAQDRIAVAVFNSDVSLIQDFTNNRGEVAAAIRRVRSGGGTAFYDALLECVDKYMRGIQGRKAIVLFTDGVDNQLMGNRSDGSRATFNQLLRRIQEIDTLIYPIFLDTESQFKRGPAGGTAGTIGDILGDIIWRRRVPMPRPVPTGRRAGDAAAYREARLQLQAIADQTGGRMYSPRAIQDLSNVYGEIADDLRVQYWLGYSSTNTSMDGSWREIRVAVKNRRDAVVRTRKGYYARADQDGAKRRAALSP